MAGQSKELFEKIRSSLGRKIIETGAVGRKGMRSLFVESRDLIESAKKIRELGFHYLIDISCFELEKTIIVDHVLRQGQEGEILFLRTSAKPNSPLERISIPSLASLYLNAITLQNGCEDQWGITFSVSEEQRTLSVSKTLGGTGFFMRSDYQFPTEIDGIRHERRRYESGIAATEMPRIEDI